jgi:hypothetical protein
MGSTVEIWTQMEYFWKCMVGKEQFWKGMDRDE